MCQSCRSNHLFSYLYIYIYIWPISYRMGYQYSLFWWIVGNYFLNMAILDFFPLLCDDLAHSFPEENPLHLSHLPFVFWLGCKSSPPKKPWLVRWNRISPKLSFMHPQLSHNVNPVDVVVVVLWMLAHSGPLGLWLTGFFLGCWRREMRNEKLKKNIKMRWF